MKNQPFKTAAILFFSFILASCSAIAPNTAEQKLPPIRVEYTLWWGDYTLLVAKEKGFFEEYGVEVEPVYYDIFAQAFSDLAAGQVDAALIASGDAMIVNRYEPIQIIGISDDGGYMPVVSNPNIKTIFDLKGKTIGTLIGTQYELLTVEMLASAGLTMNDVTVQNVNPEELAEKMEKGEVDAGLTWQPYTTQILQNGARVLYPIDNTLRLFPDTIVFRKSVIEERPDDVRAFMKAWFKAVKYRLDHPEETRKIAAKYIQVPVNDIQPDSSQKVFTYEDNLVLYAQAGIESNSIYDIAEKTASFLVSSGALTKMPDLNSIITPDFLLK